MPQYITGFAAVRWLCGYFFGVLVCLTQPRSRGHLSGNLKDKQGPMRIGNCEFIALTLALSMFVPLRFD